ETKIPGLAQRIDEARQMGDLSENAEYHAAREEMAWAQSRVKELEHILSNAEVIDDQIHVRGVIGVGSSVKVKVKGNVKEFVIVGAQEADPTAGKISNESPLGQAFLGRKKGDRVEVKVPSGIQTYEVMDVK
ncbi:MAG TPA: transcription elongation factor GreA, partial [Candidatus Kapabacteria bacterium]|nr:transcription elongation factor GreA [Candidatus Kapabacteria bacterium]